MFFFNILAFGVATVSARAIGGSASKSALSPPTPSDHCTFTPNQPPFYPSPSPSHSASSFSDSHIPPSAWLAITQLLLANTPIHHLPTKNTMQTIDLGQITNDAKLEGLRIGLMYTTSSNPSPLPVSLPIQQPFIVSSPLTSEPPSGRDEEKEWALAIKVGKRKIGWGKSKNVDGRDRDREVKKIRGVTECFEEAVRKVGERRQMEGELELEMRGDGGRGRVSFLVYRVD